MTEEASQALEPVQDAPSMEDAPNESTPSEDVKENEAPANDDDGESPEEPKAETAEELKERLEKQQAEFQKRINKKTFQQKEAERRMQDLEAQLKKIQEAQGPQPPKKPIEGDFSSYDQYQEAVAKYHRDLGRFEAERELTERQTKELQEQQQQQQQQAMMKAQAEFETRAAKFKENTPDFDNVMNDIAEAFNAYDNQTVQAIRHATLEMQDSPALLYHLGRNPETLNEVLSGSPVNALIRLGQLQNSLQSAPKPETKPVNHKPLKATSGGGQKSPDQMTSKELMDWLKS